MNGWPEAARPSDLAKLVADDKGGPLPSQTATSESAARNDVRQWTRAIARGDEVAFTRFYDQYSLRLYRHLLVLAKGNETEAGEVLQTVVIKLAKRFPVFDDEDQIWRWLCRLSQNAYVDLWRSQKRDLRLLPLSAELQDADQIKTAQDEVLLAGLDHALEHLDEEDRELMCSAYVDGRPLQELANANGQTYKAVESRLGRLRRKLKTNLLNFLRHESR